MKKTVRTTNSLRKKQALDLLAAYDHAKAIGKPLNVHVTLHWSATIEAAARVPERLQRLLERMRKWLERRSVPATFIWAQEPSARRAENRDIPHLHLLVHVPQDHRVAFTHALEEWVGGIASDNALHVEPVRPRDWNWRDYLVKGVDPDTDDAELQRIINKPSLRLKARDARGPVEGKRCGVSQNTLAPAARRRYWQIRNSAAAQRAA